ncbi:hypothetical protein Tco_0186768, partial [Tanacetum coccineum]
MKFIRALVECSSSPKVTISDICPSGHDISPLNPRKEIRWPSTSASITIGVSCPLLCPRVEKEISWSAKKLWVLLLALVMDALVCAVTLIPMKLAELVLVLVF